MKTKISFIVITILVTSLLLAGCNGQSITTVVASSGLSTATKLAAGTLKLQGTSNAITSSNAGQLVTLWEAYQSMSSSDTSSPVELEALITQIQSSMTREQVKAIDDMGLNEQSVNELVQSAASGSASLPQGSSSTSSSTSPGGASSSSSTNQGAPSSSQGAPNSSQAGGPASGMPSGNMASGPSGDSIMSTINGDGTSAQSTPSATQAVNNAASSQVSPILMQAVIQMLRSLSQTSG